MPNKRYDWEEWFKYPGFILYRGQDYDCSQSSICQQIRNEASKRKLKVAITEDDDQIVVAVRRLTNAEDHPTLDDLPGDTRIGGAAL